MLRGYRLFVLALGLILCGAQPPKEQTQSQPSVSQTQEAASAHTPYPGYNPDPCYQAKNYNAADLCAQWRAAIAAEKAAHEARRAGNWSVVATILSVLAIGGLFVTIRQGQIALDRAAQANTISKGAADAQLRPYVHIAFDSQRIKDEPFTPRSVHEICAKNFGQTPARNVRSFRGAHVAKRPIGDVVIELDEEAVGVEDIPPGGIHYEPISYSELDLFQDLANGGVLLIRFRLEYDIPSGGGDFVDTTFLIDSKAALTGSFLTLTDYQRQRTS